MEFPNLDGLENLTEEDLLEALESFKNSDAPQEAKLLMEKLVSSSMWMLPIIRSNPFSKK